MLWFWIALFFFACLCVVLAWVIYDVSQQENDE